MTTDKLKYDDSDFEVIRQQLKDTIPRLTDSWTDFNDSDPGMVIVDLLARVNDFSSYRRDRLINETLLTRATERKNVKDILKLTGYKMHSYISFTVVADLLLLSPPIAEITIPAYTQFTLQAVGDSKAVMYANTEDISFDIGQTVYAGASLTQGTAVKMELSLTDLEDGRIYLQDTNVGDNTITVITRSSTSSNADSIRWEEVDDVESSATPGTFFSHAVDKDGQDYIDLHPYYQLKLNNASIIQVFYLVSEGSKGRVGSNAKLSVVGTVLDDNGTDITQLITASSSISAIGGDDPETIEHAAKYGPIEAKTMDTLVTLQDFENYMGMYPGVAQVKALDWNYPESGITEGYKMNIYVVPSDMATLDSVTLEVYRKYLMGFKRLGSLKIYVMNPNYDNVNLEVELYMNNRSLNKSRAVNAVTSTLQNLFSPSNLNFGKAIWYTQLISKIQTADPDIERVAISGISGDIIPANSTHFIRLQNLEVTVVEV